MAVNIFEEIREDVNPELHLKLVDALPIPIFCRKKTGEIVTCNSAFARIFGLNKAQTNGKLLKNLMPFEQSEVLRRKDAEIYENGVDQYYEARLKYVDGDVRDIIVNKAAMRLNGKDISGIVSSIIDVTERKKAQEQLHKVEEEKQIAEMMLQKIRAGIVITDSNLKILDSNLGFARMIGEENEELFETIPGLKGADLEMLVPDVIKEMFKSIIESGESRIERDIRYQNKLLSVQVITIYKNKIAGAIIRDLSAPMLERAEIVERAKQVNRKNMKTVQQIAYLLGENAAQTEELLNSIVESQSYDVDED